MLRPCPPLTLELLRQRADPEGRCTDPAAILEVAALFHLQQASATDIVDGLELASSRVEAPLASAATFTAVQAVAPAAILVHRPHGRVTGLLATLPLDAEALARLRAGALDTRNPTPSQLLKPHQPAAASYTWIVAASSRTSAKALVQGLAAIHSLLTWQLVACARAVTADGARVLTSFGFQAAAGPAGYMELPPLDAPLHGFRL
ncbi:hypothetical protein ABB28_04580 [Stenotrophomonas chelatiphaga]|uniref:Uncharacterized protein n=1 Tax=Stenotrophomonas chelatiphaga TaxID=517011 RepID=A0A0R0DF97_9GAMM|nr:hypothetical protein [Stenotrophomonas chelatiphaga]KRG75912.1 hypothetical protein ABB28_04580 [Stenotrophomonas chelatiphaga]